MRKFNRDQEKTKETYEINWRIKNKVLQVIDTEGVNRGEMSKSEALELAEEAGLDLVKVGEKGDAGVAKIMDFGKFLYSKKKQQVESKKHQKVIQIKEVKMRPKIDIGDYTTKLNRAIKFLEEGKHVKFTLQFRGRQPVSVREVGEQFFDRIKNDILAAEVGPLLEEKESRSRMFWSKVFYVKEKK